MRKRLKWFDDRLIRLININIKNRFLDKFMIKFTNLGGVLSINFFILTLLFFGNDTAKIIGLEGAIALTISQSITYGLKSLLSRERPYKILENLNTFDIILKDYSFPSGHSSASFTIATIIAMTIPRISVIVFPIALIIGISRIYLGVHYPTDVAAGIVLGIISSIITHLYIADHLLGYFMKYIDI